MSVRYASYVSAHLRSLVLVGSSGFSANDLSVVPTLGLVLMTVDYTGDTYCCSGQKEVFLLERCALSFCYVLEDCL